MESFKIGIVGKTGKCRHPCYPAFGTSKESYTVSSSSSKKMWQRSINCTCTTCCMASSNPRFIFGECGERQGSGKVWALEYSARCVQRRKHATEGGKESSDQPRNESDEGVRDHWGQAKKPCCLKNALSFVLPPDFRTPTIPTFSLTRHRSPPSLPRYPALTCSTPSLISPKRGTVRPFTTKATMPPSVSTSNQI